MKEFTNDPVQLQATTRFNTSPPCVFVESNTRLLVIYNYLLHARTRTYPRPDRPAGDPVHHAAGRRQHPVGRQDGPGAGGGAIGLAARGREHGDPRQEAVLVAGGLVSAHDPVVRDAVAARSAGGVGGVGGGQVVAAAEAAGEGAPPATAHAHGRAVEANDPVASQAAHLVKKRV